jgi:hypothetical protein
MWIENHGWQRTTPTKARAVYPHGLARANDSQQFLCEICGQYANFVVGDCQQPHFRHNRCSKECEQKTTSVRNYYTTYPRGFSLPLKAIIKGNSIDVLIGFLPISDALIQNGGSLLIMAEKKILRHFDINISRFSSERVAYLSVGNTLAAQYSLSYPKEISNDYWPTVVDGFAAQGTLFDSESGKRLPRNANVAVGKQYILFVRQHSPVYSKEDVDISAKQTVGKYDFFFVKALCISRSADDFFRRFGCRLTDNPSVLTLLYPFAIRSSHVITHVANKVWFHKTSGFVEVYPQNLKPKSECFSVKSGFQQILSVSRFEDNTSVLRYTMLRKVVNISYNSRIPSLEVTDIYGLAIEGGEHDKLPRDRQFNVASTFDGCVDVIQDEFIVNKIFMPGGEKIVIDVDFNRHYRVYIGLDRVYDICFARKQHSKIIDDQKLLVKLQGFKYEPISITHSFGAVSNRIMDYMDYPKTVFWLKNQLATGIIDRKVKQYLQKVLEGLHNG